MGWRWQHRHWGIAGIMMLASSPSFSAPRQIASPPPSSGTTPDVEADEREDELPADALSVPLPEGRGGSLETTCGALLGAPFGCALMAAPCLALPPILTAAGCGTTVGAPVGSAVWQQPSFLAVAALFFLAPVYGVALPVLLASVGSLIARTDPELLFKSLLFVIPALVVGAVNTVAIALVLMLLVGTPVVGAPAFSANAGLALLGVFGAALIYFSTAFLVSPVAAVGIGIGAQVNMGWGDEADSGAKVAPEAPPRRQKKRARRRRRAVQMTY